MKRILPWFLALTFTVCLARAQDSGTQQQIDQLRGQLQDLQDAQALQAKRLDALEKEIRELCDKASGGAGASQEAVQKLADDVQAISKQQQEDKNERFHRIENFYGSFERSFSVPDDVRADSISCESKDGVLSVRIPKALAPKEKPLQIAVR